MSLKGEEKSDINTVVHNFEAKEIERYRVLSPSFRYLSFLFALVATGTAITYIFGLEIFGKRWEFPISYHFFLLGLLLPLAFLNFPMHQGARAKLPWYDCLLVFLSFGIPMYFFICARKIVFEGWEIAPPIEAGILSIIIWALVIEALRRCAGWVLFFTVLVFSTYPFFAFLLPTILSSKPYSIFRIAAFHAMGPDSIVGLPFRVVGATYIGFLLFSVVLL